MNNVIRPRTLNIDPGAAPLGTFFSLCEWLLRTLCPRRDFLLHVKQLDTTVLQVISYVKEIVQPLLPLIKSHYPCVHV